MTDHEIPWGPNGESVYERTYSRVKANGQYETWPETVERVVDGNLAFVDSRFIKDGERDKLIEYMTSMKIIPAGRHLWMSGVHGRSFVNNCFVAPWDKVKASRHFTFMFNHLMQGGGVGSNYTGVDYPLMGTAELILLCSPKHENYDELDGYIKKDVSPDELCYADVVEDSREGWLAALEELIEVHRWGRRDDVIIDLSNIRERGALIKTFGGTAAGPEPLAKLLTTVHEILKKATRIGVREAMAIDHAIAQCVVSGNVRRSARMSILHWDSPDIEWFINCKSDSGDFWTTNISVEIDDEFINLVQEYMIGQVLAGPRHDQAVKVYSAIVNAMKANGEPGIWNSSLSNEGEPNTVTATNPCGEIALPEAGVCNLGHVNLDAGMTPYELTEAHRLMTRFLIRATFAKAADQETQDVQERDRRIGVGHFGLHGYLARNGAKYSDVARASAIGSTLRYWAMIVDQEAREYSHQLRIPRPVKTRTVAPTGTIAKLAGRSEGIHPIFAPYFLRRIRFSTVDARQMKQVQEYIDQGYDVEPCIYADNTVVVTIPSKDPLVDEVYNPDILEGSEEISLRDQLQIQEMYQSCWADNAVSYTVNLSERDSAKLFDTLWKFLHSLKGTTVFPAKSRPQSPYEKISREEYEDLAARLGEHVDDGVDEECSTGACPIK